METPHFKATKNIRSSSTIRHTPTHFPNPSVPSTVDPAFSFVPQRGIGQGGSASSLMWVAVYDILLDWIDPHNKDLHPSGYAALLRPTHITAPSLSRPSGSPDYAFSNAYADDLATITTGPRAYSVQQDQAEWISAFCAFTGLQLNMQKIVPVILGDHPSTTPTFITVYNHSWQPTRCPLQRQPAALTYLGLLLDHVISGDSKKDFNTLYSTANSILEHLLDQPGPVHAKIDFIRFKILPIVLHTAQCVACAVSQT